MVIKMAQISNDDDDGDENDDNFVVGICIMIQGILRRRKILGI